MAVPRSACLKPSLQNKRLLSKPQDQRLLSKPQNKCLLFQPQNKHLLRVRTCGPDQGGGIWPVAFFR